MKKIITLLLLFISIISFSQNIEEKKANILFKEKNYAEANIIYEQLLNKEYGEINEALQYVSLTMSANCYYILKDFKKAHDKYKKLLKFLKNTDLKITDKDSLVSKFTRFMESSEMQFSDSIDSTLNKNNYSTKAEKTEINEAERSKTPEPDNKTITITVSGTGKTLEEAKLNALRSAIEQAFGAFISSKTEILNDKLIKDEIVSVASGNVEKYDVVSQIEIPNKSFAITLNATVSISKLTTFSQSKGITVEFKGGLFAMNIKLKELNEKAEYKAIKNLSATSLDMLQESYDYNLTVSEPKIESDNKNCKINFRISTVENKNYQNFINYFISTVNKIALTEAEASEIKNTGKQTYSFIIDGKLYQLRSIYSMFYLHTFFIGASLITTNSFGIYTDSGEIVKIRSRAESIINAKINENNLIVLFEHVTTDSKDYFNSANFLSSNWTLFQDYKGLNQMSKLILNSKFKPTDICFNKKISLNELEKISSFSIKKIVFFDLIKNRNLYFMKFNLNDYSNEIFRDENGEIKRNPDADDGDTYESCKN